MRKDVIIKSISLNDNLRKYARSKTKGNDLWQDIIQELVICLYDLPDEKLEKLYISGGLIPYCFKVIHLSWTSPNSPFYKKYINKTTEEITTNTTHTFIEEYDTSIDLKFQNCLINLKKIEDEITQHRYPTEVKLFNLYVELGTIRKVSEAVKIPYTAVHGIITDFRHRLMAQL